ncbi:aldehyde dehydrogenase family protein [bacterium]|jgi:succinate-semialdehyde dehydrogenase/glutarate-semialdehyde dehydrogenase|nr:aldehyde dehydrogenase family protein [bacterium]
MSTRIASINASTGQVLKEFDATPASRLPQIISDAQTAQTAWAAKSVRSRASQLRNLREALIGQTNALVELLALETGRPRTEILATELLPAVRTLSYYLNRAKLLDGKRIHLTFAKYGQSTRHSWPLGTIGVISDSQSPLFFPIADIALALLGGNAAVLIPGALAPQTGLKILELAESAGLPKNLLQVVLGGEDLQLALAKQKLGKIFYSGAGDTLQKLVSAGAESFVPIRYSLAHKDIAVVLSDADVDFASSAVAWGATRNGALACSCVERVLVHESVVTTFTDQLVRKLSTLRQGPPTDENTDLGPLPLFVSREKILKQLDEAKSAGGKVLAGGDFDSTGRFLKPTVIQIPDGAQSKILEEPLSAPIVCLQTFRSPSEAVDLANSNFSGLAAAIFTRNTVLGEQLAHQMQYSTVTLNELSCTATLPEAPWGGRRITGAGSRFSESWVFEFVNTQHLHQPKTRGVAVKSWWWFPYSPFQHTAFKTSLDLFRNNLLNRLAFVPIFLWNFVQFVKKEKRL